MTDITGQTAAKDRSKRENKVTAINMMTTEEVKSKLRELASQDRRTMTATLECLVVSEYERRKNA